MKFMLMMHAPRSGWKNAGIGTWPPEDIKAHIGFMLGFNKELVAAGELVDAQGLNLPEEARIVRAGKGGAPEVTDGPYPEAKEFLAGYWIVDVESRERAYELASRISAARACCASLRRRFSARSSVATAISRPPRMPSRRRCSRQHCSGHRRGFQTIRAAG